MDGKITPIIIDFLADRIDQVEVTMTTNEKYTLPTHDIDIIGQGVFAGKKI